MADELSQDLEELRHLRSIAKRPRIISLLSSEVLSLEKSLKAPAEPVVPAPIANTTVPVTTPGLNYTTLSSFSWEQDAEKLKIYIFLEGVDHEKVETVLKPMSVDVKFHDVQGKNYRCAIPKLNKEIVPEKSKVIVKPSKVIITLHKASKGNWVDLHFKEDKLKPNLDKDKDPMAGIMDMMKNMYEEGDEDMKRTIAKAWTESRSGKTANSMPGFP
ncbi:hypothetical protein AMTRI_Chr01g134860 [Amborella trichopoda]|uniref:Calcyclin-binding protein n=1 Tax=Amborella trichopoda TaxID=13333 RepID=W1P9Z0_AMBTC|nr:calcyclin-binding protein [Amborella trichopoda]ERN06697.1 hypothetical protein AMTR_s00058p00211870 [Amborella trichopoda]|eukprot:XP_006845022.1 calcyclin-binding protein [Amborella trichopoda]